MSRIILQRVKNYEEAADGSGFSWQNGEIICEFNSANEALDYIEANKETLPSDARFFTGSASLLVQLNSYITQIHEEMLA